MKKILTGLMLTVLMLTMFAVNGFASDVDYVVEDLTIENEGRIVPITVTTPTNVESYPLVVINHGHGGSRSENGGFDRISESLAKNGIASVRMDFAGCGDSEASFKENYLSSMHSDSIASLMYVLNNTEKYNVKKDSIGVLGYSMGARVTMRDFADGESLYSAVAILAGSTDDGVVALPRLVATEGKTSEDYFEEAKENGFAVYPWYGANLEISSTWFEEMAASTPLKDFEGYTGPLMSLNGDKDDVIAKEAVEGLKKAYPNAEFVTITGADHGYGFYSEQPEVTELLESSLVNFFTKAFQAK